MPAGKELVRPEACFVVKSTVKTEADAESGEKGSKIFINIVQSDKIDKPTSVAHNDGMQMSLPLSLGPKRLEKDKGGDVLVPTFDACFHPDALTLVRSNKQFKEYLITTALEHAEEALHTLKPRGRPGKPPAYRDKVSKEYHILRGVAYKNGTPAIMMMAKEGFAAEAAASASAGGGSKAAAPQVPASLKAAAKATAEPSKAAATPRPKKSSSGETSSVPKGFLNKAGSAGKVSSKAGSAAAAAPAANKKPPVSVLSSTPAPEPLPPAPPSSNSSGSSDSGAGALEPSYTVKERGLFELADHTNGRVLPHRRPRELEVCLQLPSLAAPSHMDLDVGDHRLKFTANRAAASPLSTSSSVVSTGKDAGTSATYLLDLHLPYPCVGEKGKAKFDKAKKELRVTIPVVPPSEVSEEELLGNSSSAVTELPNGQQPEKSAAAAAQEDGTSEQAASAPDKEEGEEDGKTTTKAPPKPLQADRDHARFLDRSAPVLASGRETFDLPPGATLVAPPPDPSVLAAQRAEKAAAAAKAAKSSATAAAQASSSSSSSSQQQKASQPLEASAAAQNIVRFNAKRPFTAATTWSGPCPGFVFKLGPAGLGYYYEGGGDSQSEGDFEDEDDDDDNEDVVEAAVPWEEAPFEFRQLEAVVTILVQAPRIDAESAAVTFDANGMVTVAVKIKGGEGASEKKETTDAAGGESKRLRVAWQAAGALDADRCRFDVADKNMVVVLFKATPGEHWEVPLQVVEPFPGAEDEAKREAEEAAAKKAKKQEARRQRALAAREQAAANAQAAAAVDNARATEKAILTSQLELERAMAQRSAAASDKPIGRTASGAMTSALPMSPAILSSSGDAAAYDPPVMQGADNGFRSMGSGVAAPNAAAPVAFQNAFMFELD